MLLTVYAATIELPKVKLRVTEATRSTVTGPWRWDRPCRGSRSESGGNRITGVQAVRNGQRDGPQFGQGLTGSRYLHRDRLAHVIPGVGFQDIVG